VRALLVQAVLCTVQAVLCTVQAVLCTVQAVLCTSKQTNNIINSYYFSDCSIHLCFLFASFASLYSRLFLSSELVRVRVCVCACDREFKGVFVITATVCECACM
jgi:hypothetical protein